MQSISLRGRERIGRGLWVRNVFQPLASISPLHTNVLFPSTPLFLLPPIQLLEFQAACLFREKKKKRLQELLNREFGEGVK